MINIIILSQQKHFVELRVKKVLSQKTSHLHSTLQSYKDVISLIISKYTKFKKPVIFKTLAL